MNNTQKLAQERFNGNMEETYKYIMLNVRGEELEKYIDEWTPDETAHALNFWYSEVKDRIGEDKVNECFKQAREEAEFNLTYDEIKNCEKNPLKRQMLKDLLKLVLVNAALIGVYAVSNYFEAGEYVQMAAATLETILTANYSLNLGVDLVKYFRFKKLQKELRNKDENLNEGKSL